MPIDNRLLTGHHDSKAVLPTLSYDDLMSKKVPKKVRRLATQPVRGSKNRLLAGFKFLKNPLKLLAVIITAISPGHVTGIITLMPIARVTTARNGVVTTMFSLFATV